MDLSILIVTYNSAHLIGALLTKVHAELEEFDGEVIIVDNASRDGTAALVREHFPWVQLIESDINLGFAAGNNLAAAQARGRYILLLNPDAVPAPGSLARGVALMDGHPDAGLAGGELRGVDGSRQPSARMFPTLRDEFFTLAGLSARYPTSKLFSRLDRRWADPEQPALVDWIPGAFVFIPIAVFREMGGFDERFFLYSEEVDLCRRMQAAGYRIYYWPELKAMHIGGESAKTVAKARVSKSGSQLQSWRMRSALLYYRKHHGALGAGGYYWLELVWHRLRQFKARISGQAEKADDFDVHCGQLNDAWRDTDHGRQSPPRPW